MGFLLGCKTLWKLYKRVMVLNSQNPEDCWTVMYIPGRDLFIYPLTVCILGQAPVDVESIGCVKESFVSECQLFPGERGVGNKVSWTLFQELQTPLPSFFSSFVKKTIHTLNFCQQSTHKLRVTEQEITFFQANYLSLYFFIMIVGRVMASDN